MNERRSEQERFRQRRQASAIPDAVRKARTGDQEAYTFLFEESREMLKREALKYLKSEFDADDAVQNTFIAIFQHLNDLQDPEKFIPWSVQICRRNCINECKRKSRVNEQVEFRPVTSEEDQEGLDTLPASSYDTSYNPEASIDGAETKRLLDEMIGDLPEMQRVCIVQWQEGFSTREIAETTGLPEGTVKSNVSYAKRKIKEKVLRLEKQGTKLYGLGPIPFFLWIMRMYGTEYHPAAAAAAQSSLSAIASAAAKETAQAAGNAAVHTGTAGAAAAGAKTAAGIAAKTAAVAVGTVVTAGGILYGTGIIGNREQKAVDLSLFRVESSGEAAESLPEVLPEESQEEADPVLHDVPVRTEYYTQDGEKAFYKEYTYSMDGRVIGEALFKTTRIDDQEPLSNNPPATPLYSIDFCRSTVYLYDAEGRFQNSLVYEYRNPNTPDQWPQGSWEQETAGCEAREIRGDIRAIDLSSAAGWSRAYLAAVEQFLDLLGEHHGSLTGCLFPADEDGIPELVLTTPEKTAILTVSEGRARCLSLENTAFVSYVPGTGRIQVSGFLSSREILGRIWPSITRIYEMEDGRFVLKTEGGRGYVQATGPAAFEYMIDEKRVSEEEYGRILQERFLAGADAAVTAWPYMSEEQLEAFLRSLAE